MNSTSAALSPSPNGVPTPPGRRYDPRWWQICCLGSLLTYGLLRLNFDTPVIQVVATIGTALTAQYAFTRLLRLPAFEWKSALISGFGLCFLFRANDWRLAVLCAAIAIGSKFLIRFNGKHLWNPTNIALVIMMLAFDQAWVSPGQWGSGPTLAYAMACAGAFVVNRSARSDTSIAFIAAYAAVLIGRSLWVGEPLTIPLHRLQNGALMIFTFHMISDPKTTPNTRAGRILFAGLVALGAGFVAFGLFRPNGPIWALAALSPLVPLIDRLLPGPKYEWKRPVVGPLWKEAAHPVPLPAAASRRLVMERKLRHSPAVSLLLAALAAVAASMLAPSAARAFCGFYVATGDMRIYNKASKVVIARDGDRTVLTMSSDFRGDPKQFAVVVPVPVVLQKQQVHIGDSAAVTHLDHYSVPRLVEYTDPNPCPERRLVTSEDLRSVPLAAMSLGGEHYRGGKGDVVIQAQYRVDEYEILILSAKEGRALGEWLRANGYTMPPGAAPVLSSYIKQGMYFFVAKVDVAEQQRLGYSYLRPIQVAFESPKFMLPLRLGMVNADGPQEMFVFTLTRGGRVESTNYRTVRMPTDIDVPEFVKREFTSFYPQLFEHHRRTQGEGAVFLEYAWVVTPSRPNCDPCTAPVLTPDELRGLGTFWIARDNRPPRDVFLTRLHLRYDARHFPEDLLFHETGDRENWQARYVIHHPYPGNEECAQRGPYLKTVWARRAKEAANYASLTGMDEGAVRKRMDVREDWSYGDETIDWWERIWR